MPSRTLRRRGARRHRRRRLALPGGALATCRLSGRFGRRLSRCGGRLAGAAALAGCRCRRPLCSSACRASSDGARCLGLVARPTGAVDAVQLHARPPCRVGLVAHRCVPRAHLSRSARPSTQPPSAGPLSGARRRCRLAALGAWRSCWSVSTRATSRRTWPSRAELSCLPMASWKRR